ncbi:MAG: hypothetical protein SVY53_12185 [Chloroflexota bacterium]|nr:hypothetical protein [Chloroflexota bacterium]
MSDRVKWVESNGTEILFCDYRGLKGDEHAEAIEAQENEILNHKSDFVRVVIDMYDSNMSDSSMQKADESQARIKDQGIQVALSVIGLGRIQRTLAQAFRKDIYFAKDFDDAKQWLVNN